MGFFFLFCEFAKFTEPIMRRINGLENAGY